MDLLKKALIGNALFSSTSGAILIIFQRSIMEWFEIGEPTVFWITGILLLFFAITIGVEVRKMRKWPILWIIAQDALWVIGSMVILLWKPFEVSSIGYWLIDGVAILVGVFMILQAIGLKRMLRTQGQKKDSTSAT